MANWSSDKSEITIGSNCLCEEIKFFNLGLYGSSISFNPISLSRVKSKSLTSSGVITNSQLGILSARIIPFRSLINPLVGAKGCNFSLLPCDKSVNSWYSNIVIYKVD